MCSVWLSFMVLLAHDGFLSATSFYTIIQTNKRTVGGTERFGDIFLASSRADIWKRVMIPEMEHGFFCKKRYILYLSLEYLLWCSGVRLGGEKACKIIACSV